MRIQACLNGARPRDFHPALPLDTAALAHDAAACAAVGAVALHLHPRDATGCESLAPAVIGAAVRAVRAATGLPVSVSTGAWIAPPVERHDGIAGWAALGAARPDEASVNLSEADAPDSMAALRRAGVGIEAGLASVGDAARLLSLGLDCRRVLVEIPDLPAAEAVALAHAILDRLDAAQHPAERQLHGEGRSVWPCFDLARELGLMARLGLEDGALLPDGRQADGNAALVAAGLARAGAPG
ncbi:3-keto-5-aminohexanoate cleavage protein [Roseomonas sp. OT10]|uniref:3-keto-5-aminohexanoate cleavage protein n=1 Tax=Roseomonas cutis TaxID=2897332 RepID=UPI001E64CBF8|nr:3-keto-5-aminohexanoate cleavage protein [Roseomonas sp. OT10]UFN46983.1 3-keto-5-aminohexanoate cleavage protein [Roseomonas sp. OT10]